MKVVFRASLIIILGLAVFGGPAAGQSKHRVKFKKGATSAKIKGTIRGYDYRDYLIEASAGQTMTVKLSSLNTYTMFSILRPNGENLEGASQVLDHAGRLPESGDYVIRVGMMRAEARRKGSASDYVLTISIP